MDKNAKIYLAGHRGMVGSAIFRKLKENGFNNIVTRTHPELDLSNQQAVNAFFDREKPDYVFVAAAKVGGIVANNTFRAQFIYENLMIQNNIIHNSYVHEVKKLIFLGSSCIYPKMAQQPIKEEYLLSDYLEQTNEPYAIAKITGLKMCENYYRQYGCNFYSLMPSNLYGKNDNFNLKQSHVLSALLRKMHLGKCLENNDWDAVKTDIEKYPIEGINSESSHEDILQALANNGVHKIGDSVHVDVWGTGTVLREFLNVDDVADGVLYLAKNYDLPEFDEVKDFEKVDYFFNIGSGVDVTINELAQKIKQIIGFRGELVNDTSRPDGTPRKLLDVSRLKNKGWEYRISLEEGIKSMYNWYLEQQYE